MTFFQLAESTKIKKEVIRFMLWAFKDMVKSQFTGIDRVKYIYASLFRCPKHTSAELIMNQLKNFLLVKRMIKQRKSVDLANIHL